MSFELIFMYKEYRYILLELDVHPPHDSNKYTYVQLCFMMRKFLLQASSDYKEQNDIHMNLEYVSSYQIRAVSLDKIIDCVPLTFYE